MASKAKLSILYLRLNQSERHIYSSSQNMRRLIITERPALGSWNLECGVSHSLPTLKWGFSGIILASFHCNFQEGRFTLTLDPSLLLKFIHQAFGKAEAGRKEPDSGQRLLAVSILL